MNVLPVPVIEKVKVGEVYVEMRNTGLWAVCRAGCVLTKNNKWVYEPLPSSRTDAFKSKTRFSYEEAVRRAQEMHKVKS